MNNIIKTSGNACLYIHIFTTFLNIIRKYVIESLKIIIIIKIKILLNLC